MTARRTGVRVVVLVVGLGVFSAVAAAQSPPVPAQNPPTTQTPPAGARQGQGQRGPGRAAIQPGSAQGGATNAEIQQLFDALVVSKAQNALQLSNDQFNVFLPKLLALQNLEHQHRNQRNKALADIRALIVPKAQEVDDASIAAANKALDDLEVQMQQGEQRALVAIDSVLTVRQRAHFRLFQENMERQKLELLVQARAGTAPPAPDGRRGGGL